MCTPSCMHIYNGIHHAHHICMCTPTCMHIYNGIHHAHHRLNIWTSAG